MSAANVGVSPMVLPRPVSGLTSFERRYSFATPFLPALYREVRKKLTAAVGASASRPDLLDVGGRKSHYTIGLPANVTIAELPRVSDVQRQLNLGITDAIINQTTARRSNVRGIVYDDMTQSRLGNGSYDVVSAVEVLEHVEADAAFVHEVYRVLRPGGVFVMTTPNGEWIPNTNPDHKRHYRQQQLHDLLASAFDTVQVEFAVKSTKSYEAGLRSWSLKRPVVTLLSMLGNVVSGVQSANRSLKSQPYGTVHLVAVATKRRDADAPATSRATTGATAGLS